jgi:hypothetical protein
MFASLPKCGLAIILNTPTFSKAERINMAESSFGQRVAATIRAELGQLDDDQEQIVANLIDREYAAAQGKLPGFALEHTSLIQQGSRKLREELFDGLCGACNLQREGMTRPMARTVSVALTAIMAVMPNLTTNEILIRAREYRRRHPTWELTPNSLSKHWGSCATRESVRGLLDEPAGWRQKHQDIFPPEQTGATGEMFARNPWERIGRVYQEKIIRFMSQAPRRPVAMPHAD